LTWQGDELFQEVSREPEEGEKMMASQTGNYCAKKKKSRT